MIKYAWEEDIWFHADKHSSAHVYLRLKDGESFENINPLILERMAQLTKANSIEGNKKNVIDIIYTPASNLKKTNGMEVGSVYYHNKNMVKKLFKVEKNKDILKPIVKSKIEEYPDLNLMKISGEKEKLMKKKQLIQKQKEEQKIIDLQKKKEDEEWEKQRKEFEVNSDNENEDDSCNSDDFI